MAGQCAERLLQLAAAHPLLEAAMAGLKWRVLLRQFAPLGSGAEHPQHAVEHGSGVMPGPAAQIGPPRRPQDRLDHLPLFIGQFPASSHRRRRTAQSKSSMHLNAALA